MKALNLWDLELGEEQQYCGGFWRRRGGGIFLEKRKGGAVGLSFTT